MNIHLSLHTIASLIGTNCPASRDQNLVIKKIASLETAGPEDLAVILDRGDASVFDAVALEKVKNCKACVILARSQVAEGKAYLLVDDVLTAFTKLVDQAQKNTLSDTTLMLTATGAHISQHATIDPTATIQPLAVICAGTIIGAHTTISAHCFIGNNCTIGAGVLLHPGVKILDYCTIDDGTIIHAGAVIGSDGFGYEVTKRGLRKIPQIGIVTIGKMVEIGANCTIDRASFDKTVIGNMVKMDNGIHIAHNVTIGDGTAILAQTGIAGSAKIGTGCQIGGQVAIKNDVTIGNGVKIVSKSAVMNDIKDGETVCGMPAIPFMQWKRLHATINKLPEWGKLVAQLKDVFPTAKLTFWQKIKLLLK